MKFQIGEQQFEAEGRYLTLSLPDSSALLGQPAALRQRLAEDGFLYIRGFHDRREVLECRREMLQRMHDRDMLREDAPLMDGVVNAAAEKRTSSVRGNEFLKGCALREILFGSRTMSFFQNLLGGPPMHLNFEWLRAAPPGASSPIHYDIVYMSRGTKNLYTLWTPFGDIPPQMGPLAVCLNSHRWTDVINTYGQDDVDRQRTPGVFTLDPAELVDRFGGRWATTYFEAGDAVVLSMYNMHASLVNETDRYRISCDSRYQLASEPADERWVGESPRGHEVLWSDAADLEPLAVSRARWGLA